HGGDNAIAGALEQVPDERAANAEPHYHELVDAEVIQHAQVVVGVGIPGALGLERAGGVAASGVAQIGRNTVVLALELRDRIERPASEAGERRIQPSAGNEQQREAGAVLLKMDAHGAFFIKAHSLSLPGLLSEYAWCSGHRGRRDAGGQNIAPV